MISASLRLSVVRSVRLLRIVGLRRVSSRIRDHYFDYFESSPDHKTVARSDPKLRSNVSNANFSDLTDDELVEAVLSCKASEFSRQLLDEECRRRLPKLRFDVSVRLAHAWWTTIANEAFAGEFFRSALAYWPLHLRFATKFEFVHLVYLLGQNRATGIPKHLSNALCVRFGDFLPSLTPKEVAVVCNGLFKLRTGIFDAAALHDVARRAEELMEHAEDRFDLVSVLKFFRLCRYHDEGFLAKLGDYVRAHACEFNVTECAHFLAAYASVNVYERDVFLRLSGRAFRQLKVAVEGGTVRDPRAHPSECPRVKDVAKLLWAIANVGHAIDEEQSSTAVRFLEGNYTPSASPQVVDALQSLACLGTYPAGLIRRVCTPAVERKLARMSKQKPLQQWLFVKNSADIMLRGTTELPPWTGVDAEPSERRGLMDFVEAFAPEGLFTSYVLPHVRIAGVTLSISSRSAAAEAVGGLATENTFGPRLSDELLESIAGRSSRQRGSVESPSHRILVSVEVLDECVLTKGSSRHLLGVMRAKVQQLKRLGVKVAFLTPDFVRTLREWPRERRTEWFKEFVKDCLCSADEELCYGLSEPNWASSDK